MKIKELNMMKIYLFVYFLLLCDLCEWPLRSYLHDGVQVCVDVWVCNVAVCHKVKQFFHSQGGHILFSEKLWEGKRENTVETD